MHFETLIHNVDILCARVQLERSRPGYFGSDAVVDAAEYQRDRAALHQVAATGTPYCAQVARLALLALESTAGAYIRDRATRPMPLDQVLAPLEAEALRSGRHLSEI